jgi:hypothetical protein
MWVRAVPGIADAPVVIHCVDTGEAPQPFRLGIHPARFFGDRPITVDLLTPTAYDRAAHERAEQTKDCAALPIRRRLAAGCVTEIEVPACRIALGLGRGCARSRRTAGHLAAVRHDR